MHPNFACWWGKEDAPADIFIYTGPKVTYDAMQRPCELRAGNVVRKHGINAGITALVSDYNAVERTKTVAIGDLKPIRKPTYGRTLQVGDYVVKIGDIDRALWLLTAVELYVDGSVRYHLRMPFPDVDGDLVQGEISGPAYLRRFIPPPTRLRRRRIITLRTRN